MKQFEGIVTEFSNDGTVDIVMKHNKSSDPKIWDPVSERMTFTRTAALGMAMSLIRCVVKATVWKMKSKQRA